MLSHDVLLYYRGIINEIPHEDLLFVRIRGDDDEFIESWNANSQPYEAHWYEYFPNSHENDTIVKIEHDKWVNMTVEEKAQWFADEVEARWLRSLSDHHDIRTLEVNWSNRRKRMEALLT